jgi:hypothetical protein
LDKLPKKPAARRGTTQNSLKIPEDVNRRTGNAMAKKI